MNTKINLMGKKKSQKVNLSVCVGVSLSQAHRRSNNNNNNKTSKTNKQTVQFVEHLLNIRHYQIKNYHHFME